MSNRRTSRSTSRDNATNRRQSRSSSRDNVHHRRRSSRSRSRANSLSSDSIMSRESVSEFKLKLASMESDLDATLRSLTGSDVNSSEAATRDGHAIDVQSTASTNPGAPSLISKDSLDGRGASARNVSAPPRNPASPPQMKRNTANVSPVPRTNEGPSRHSTSESPQGDLNERLETQEKCVKALKCCVACSA